MKGVSDLSEAEISSGRYEGVPTDQLRVLLAKAADTTYDAERDLEVLYLRRAQLIAELKSRGMTWKQLALTCHMTIESVRWACGASRNEVTKGKNFD